jgi:gentisate 1,2-dioxygenase
MRIIPGLPRGEQVSGLRSFWSAESFVRRRWTRVTLESMTISYDFESPVHLQAVAAENLPPVTPALEDLYGGFEKELLIPLWTEIGDLMPLHPRSEALPYRWQWESLRALAAQAGGAG